MMGDLHLHARGACCLYTRMGRGMPWARMGSFLRACAGLAAKRGDGVAVEKGGRAYMRQTQIAFRARWVAACLGVQGGFFVGSAGGGDGRGGFALVGLCACGGRILPFGHVGAVLQGHVKPAATGKVDGGHALGAGHALRDGQGRPAHGGTWNLCRAGWKARPGAASAGCGSVLCRQEDTPPIMATCLAGSLAKPYQGMGPAALTRPELPGHMHQSPLDAC